QREVLSVLLKLPEVQRMSIYSRYYEGLTPTEIAAKQNVPVKTVKTRLSRGLESLRTELDERVDGGRDRWMVGLAPIALLSYSGVTIGLASTKVGTGSLKSFLSGVAVNKALIGVAIVLAAIIGLRAIEGTAIEPAVANSVATISNEFVAPVTKLNTPELAAIAPLGGRAPVAVTPVVSEEESELGSLKLRMVWEDGTPAIGVHVYGHTPGVPSDRETEHRGVSGDDGTIILSGLYPGKFQLRSPHGYRNYQSVIVAGEKTEYTWKLTGGATVRGKVLDDNGQPVANAQIWLREYVLSWPAAVCVARTNTTGAFIVLGVNAQTIMGARGRSLRPSTDFDVNAMPFASDGAREITFTLGEPAIGIEGVVLNPKGEPVSGALVHAEGGAAATQVRRADPRFASLGETLARRVPVVTDAQGRFVLPGGYVGNPSGNSIPIHAQAPGFPTWSGQVVLPKTGLAEVRIQLAHGAVIEGKVIDSEGKPVANARLRCAVVEQGKLTESAFPIPKARTDSKGSYRMELVPPGTQFISATGRDERLGRAYEQVTCVAGETSQLDIQLDPHPLVSGSVVDAKGKPLSGCRVVAWSGKGNVSMENTDESGRFLLSNVGDAVLKLEIYKPGEWLTPFLTKRISPGTEGLAFVIEEADSAKGSLKGIVHDSDGNVPLAARLMITPESNPNQGYQVEFDPKTGSFEYGPVQVDRYRLRLLFDWNGVSVSDWIQVVQDETTDLARIIHEHADQTPRTSGTAGLLVPAGTLQILASSTTLQGRLRGQVSAKCQQEPIRGVLPRGS
ncbi:MAG: protocatechuate 3,4-dioxygenase beta subunit, partial [Planctomycetota bacterium]